MTAFVLLSLILVKAGAAEGAPPPSHIRAELADEAQLLEDGGGVEVAVRLTPKDGWHTYWRNSGDSGQATRLSWKLPDGWIAGPIEWPVPSRIPLPRVVDYGYPGPASLVADLRSPRSVSDGERLPISVKVKWLECREICVPGGAELTADLTARLHSEAIGRARSRLPGRLGEGPWAGWKASAVRNGNKIELRLSPAPAQASAAFFPYDNETIENAAKQSSKLSGDTLVLELEPSSVPESDRGKTLSGVVALKPSNSAVEISAPIEGN
jgi:DsbC/DsbD-like thiol-disulfide interchange protein